MCDDTPFYACKSPDQTPGHTEMGCQPGDCKWSLIDVPPRFVWVCNYAWVNIITLEGPIMGACGQVDRTLDS